MPRIIWLRGLCKPSQQVQALIDLIGAGDQWQRKTPYHELYHVYYLLLSMSYTPIIIINEVCGANSVI